MLWRFHQVAKEQPEIEGKAGRPNTKHQKPDTTRTDGTKKTKEVKQKEHQQRKEETGRKT